MKDVDSTLIATHSGLRGRPGAGLTARVVSDAVGGMIEVLDHRERPLTMGVARDARVSGRPLLNRVTRALTARGVDVVDFGAVSTPTAKLAAREMGLGGVIVVTGSHLGTDWNGLKLMVGPGYEPLDAGALPRPGGAPPGRRGRVTLDDTAARRHAAALCAAVDADAIRSASLTVRVEGGAGSAAGLALRGLGCPSSGRPVDVALVLDADGDRVELEDADGARLDSEATLCLAALGADAETVVKGEDTSAMIDLLMADRGGTVHTTPPGEVHLLQALRAKDADLAGEGNGGVVVPEVGLARDGLAAGVLVVQLMARTGAGLSALAAGLPRLSRRRSTVPCSGEASAHAALAALAGRVGEPFEEGRRGVRVRSRSGATWALVRQSATEPVLRVTVESPDPAVAEELEAELRAGLAATG